MARRHYRWFSSGLWQSQSGNAIFAIINPNASSKRAIIHSMEIYSHKAGNTSAYPAFEIVTGSSSLTATSIGGEVVSAAPFDSTASLSSGVLIRKNTSISASTSRIYTAISPRLTTTSAFMSNAYGNKTFAFRKSRCSYYFDQYEAGTQALTLRQNEFMAISERSSNTVPELIPVEVQVVFRYNSQTYSSIASPCFVSNTGSQAFILHNTTSTPLYIKKIFLRELGTSDTPYFQLVPIGAIDPNTIGDQYRRGVARPLDTAHGEPQSGDPIILLDSPLLPFGVPQQYLSDGSSGTPKGFNYLHTKDFVGPAYMTMFPEFPTIDPTFTSCGLAWWRRSRRFIDSRFNLTLNEGEGVALVSSAETATITTAIGTSGWQPFDFGIQFSVEPKDIPVIKATGIVQGSTWVIQKTSSGATVAQGTVGANGEISYTYTDEDTPLGIRLRIRKGTAQPFYKPYEVSFTLTTAGVNIPVSQIPD